MVFALLRAAGWPAARPGELATRDHRNASEARLALTHPGDRCSMTFQYLPLPRREMTPEAKASLRRKRLERRMKQRTVKPRIGAAKGQSEA